MRKPLTILIAGIRSAKGHRFLGKWWRYFSGGIFVTACVLALSIAWARHVHSSTQRVKPVPFSIGASDIFRLERNASISLPRDYGQVLSSLGRDEDTLLPETVEDPVIPGVPDYQPQWSEQWPDGNTCAVGCTIMAAGNILGYWDDHGCEDLMPGDGGGYTTSCNEGCRTALRSLRSLMGTYCDGNSGLTPTENHAPALEQYFQEAGCGFHAYARGGFYLPPEIVSPLPEYPSLWEPYVENINNGWPVLISYKPGSGSEAHSVTGVGYEGEGSGRQFLVHDNVRHGDRDNGPAEHKVPYYGNFLLYGILEASRCPSSPTTSYV